MRWKRVSGAAFSSGAIRRRMIQAKHPMPASGIRMKRIFAGIPASVAEAGEISAGSMWISFPSSTYSLATAAAAL